MCSSPDIPTPEPVAPTAPVAVPQPLGAADGESRKPLGLSQLRIGSRSQTAKGNAAKGVGSTGAIGSAGGGGPGQTSSVVAPTISGRKNSAQEWDKFQRDAAAAAPGNALAE